MRAFFMPSLVLPLLTIAAIAPARAAILDGPLEPAAHGQFQCIGPDTAKKTCLTLSSFALGPKNEIDNTQHVLISRKPAVVMTTVSPVVIKGTRVCNTPKAEDIAGATFTVDYKPATPAQQNTFRAVIKSSMAPAFGQTVCTALVADRDAVWARVSINGQPQPGGDQKVMWVPEIAGYTVSP